MDWIAARSYYIGYRSIDRFDSIIFTYNYFSTLSLGFLCSLILPIIFLFAPSLFQTKRTSQFFLISTICLANMCFLYIHSFMFTGSGEPNLSIATCEFVVYISTFAKPMGLYLTFLSGIERIFTKILRKTNYQLIFKRIYLFSIALTMVLILSIKLYETIKWIPNGGVPSQDSSVGTDDDDGGDDDDDDDQTINNSTDEILSFQYCYRTMNIQTYSKILSFYLVQYWYEYVIFALNTVMFLFFLIYQYALPYIHHRTLTNISLNSRFYILLSLSVVLFEFIFQGLHRIVDAEENNNSDKQVNYLQTMVFIYNLRAIFLPIFVCLITRNSFKEWIYDFFVTRSYLDAFDENDRLNLNSPTDQTELVLSPIETSEKDHFDT